MRYLLLVSVSTGLAGIIYWMNSARSLIDYRVVEFDVGQLLDLKSNGAFDPDHQFTHDLSVIFYFSELSCTTCTTRELENLAVWYQRYREHVDFYLVVHGQDPLYLSNLRRIGKVEYPIFSEAQQGDLGIHDTAILVASKARSQILASYRPSADEETAHEITVLEQFLVGLMNGSRSI